MFREMRRKKQCLSQEESIQILREGSSGVLALLGDDDYPYAVPLSYVYDGNGKIYFHGARSGHKIDAIKKCQKASFCVIEQDHVIPEKYTTYFRSVIVFGNIRIIEDEAEIKRAAEVLAMKYYANGGEAEHKKEIEKEWNRLCMMELTVEYISGKEGIELVGKDG